MQFAPIQVSTACLWASDNGRARYGRKRGRTVGHDFAVWHRALLRGDPDAPDVLARALFSLVAARARYQWPSLEDEMIVQAADDAVCWYLKYPKRYDASVARLDVFLGKVACRRIQDALKQRARVRSREVGVSDSALDALAATRPIAATLDVVDDTSQRERLLALANSDEERAFLEAYLASDVRGRSEGARGDDKVHQRTANVDGRLIVQRLRQRARRQRMR